MDLSPALEFFIIYNDFQKFRNIMREKVWISVVMIVLKTVKNERAKLKIRVFKKFPGKGIIFAYLV
ncbi:hypothetical protein ACTXT7_000631 [Hymenolepis weldensis]